MKTKRSAKTPRPVSQPVRKVRADLSAALLRSADVHGLTQDGLAGDVGVDERTVRRWLKCDVKMDVELVAAALLIGKTFRRLWCSEGHDPAPYVARRRGRAA